jgi:hypothetical protein
MLNNSVMMPRHSLHIAACLIWVTSSAVRAEPISDQGLVRAFAEDGPRLSAKTLTKMRAGHGVLPPGMQHGLTMDQRFCEPDPADERFTGYNYRGGVRVQVIDPTFSPHDLDPRVY